MLDPSNLQFTPAELLAEIGAKQLIIQRQAARIAELEAALLGDNEPARSLRAVGDTNGTKAKA